MNKDKNMILESGMKRFQQIMEYTTLRKGVVGEADGNQGPDMGGAPAPGGDPGMGGAPAPGGDPGMGGAPAPGGDPGMGGAPAPGGDPGMGGAPAPGGDPGMGGDPNGGAQGPEGFNPQGVEDQAMGGDPMMGDPTMGGDPGMGGEQMQPDDEVIDVDELTDAQEDTEHEVEKLGDKFDKVLKAIGAFEELIRANDEKIEGLKTEFEKRNPTQIEKLSMQTTKSYPFNVTPDEYWKEKEATSNYSTEDDNNGKDQGQYVITKNDVDGAVDWKGISDSLDDDDDFMYNQTLNKILSM